MKVIADSGSTKTTWAILENSKDTTLVQSEGVNPVHLSTDEIYGILKGPLQVINKGAVEEVWFYGAGLVGNENKQIVNTALKKLFPMANIMLESDLMAAAHACLGKNKGIACILGTGSNSCLYDGAEIIEHISPLGYILGDEGSGAVMGKKLVGDYLKGLMPEILHQKFKEKYKFTATEYLNLVYKQAKPNQFLATFTKFLGENIDAEYCCQFVYSEFDSFVKRNLLSYSGIKTYPISVVGSVGFHFKEIFEEVLEKYQLKLGKVLKDPMQELIKYHSKQNNLL